MRQQLLLLTIGALAGGGTVYWAKSPAGQTPSSAFDETSSAETTPLSERLQSSEGNRSAGMASATDAAEGSAAARLHAHERAGLITDRSALEAAIVDAASEFASPARDTRLEALLARLAELDPGRAARLAASLNLHAHFLEPVFRAWAADDAGAVLAELGRVESPTAQRALALAVLAAIGNDEAGIARVAALLPVSRRFGFEVDAYALRAEYDVAGALAAIAAAGKSELFGSLLFARIGEAAARRDPRGALALAATIAHAESRRHFRTSVFSAWSEFDPAGVLEYLETAERGSVPNIYPTVTAIVAGDPDAVLEDLERFPSYQRRALQRAALTALAETDPLATLARLDALPRGADREMLLETVAESYGQQDPGAALAWAASLQPPSQRALNGAIAGVAAGNMNRAIDWIVREVENPSAAGVNVVEAFSAGVVFQGMLAGGVDVPAAVDRLLATNNPTLKTRAATMMFAWAQRDAEDAVGFALTRLDAFAPNELTSLAQQVSTAAPELAVQTLERLPPAYRANWAASVASTLVRSNPDRALGFLAEQRGQPGHEQGVIAVATQLATTDQPAAAALLATVEPSPRTQAAAVNVANAWGREDPLAAAAWALRLERPEPIGAVAGGWARNDPGAAEQWALTLPPGDLRDAGITAVLSATAAAGEPRLALLDRLSSDGARQQSASRVILQIGRTDQARARALMNTHLSDPALRQRTEQQLAQLAQLGAAGSSPPVPFIDMQELQEAMGR